MKKNILTAVYKRYRKRHSRKVFEKRKRFDDYLLNKNKEELGINHLLKVKKRTINGKYHNYVKVKAPSVFSFTKNPLQVVKFINRLNQILALRKRVFVIMDDITEISHDAIVVLLSSMIRFKAAGVDFNGDFPKSIQARKILVDSGFLSTLYSRKIADEDNYKLGKVNGLYTHAKKNVDAELGDKIVEFASQTVWKQQRRCPGVQRALLELMQNTNNHADIHKEGEKHWWLSVNHNKKDKVVSFSFVDFGVGVFKSLDNKQISNKFFGWRKILFDLFNFRNNAELIELVLKGKLHASVTGKPYRGKGLPGVFEAATKGEISNLYIITNDVFVNAAESKFNLLPEQFNGTFVYWELRGANFNLSWEDETVDS